LNLKTLKKVQKREEQIHKLQLERDALKQQVELVGNKVKETNSSLENVKKQVVQHQSEIRARDETIKSMDRQLDENQIKFQMNNNEIEKLDKQIKSLHDEINNMNDFRDELEHKVCFSYRVHHSVSLTSFETF
jgi:chromosome segregation ATPase